MYGSTKKTFVCLFSLYKGTHGVFHTSITSLDKGVLAPRIFADKLIIEVKGLEHIGLDTLPHFGVFLV